MKKSVIPILKVMVKKMLTKIMIVDGSNMLHRQMHQPALAELQYNGQKTGAVFGFMRSLLVSMERYPDYYPVVVFDKGRSPRRMELYPNYKRAEDRKIERDRVKLEIANGRLPKSAGEDEFLNDLISQGEIIKSVLSSFKIPMVSIYQWEGDDIIAIISRFVKESVIVTDDKDMYQLTSPNDIIFRPIRTAEDGTRGQEVRYEDVLGSDEGRRRFIIAKAIGGDGSDNIPQVARGLGPKRSEVIVDTIIESNEDPSTYLPILESMDNKYVKLFLENHDQYILNMKLVDLSLIDNDQSVISELANEIQRCSSDANFIEVVSALGAYGIKDFDYSRMITLLSGVKRSIL